MKRAQLLLAVLVLGACAGEDSTVEVGDTVAQTTVATPPATVATTVATTTGSATTAPSPTMTAGSDGCVAGFDQLPPLVVAGDGNVTIYDSGESRSTPLDGVRLAYLVDTGTVVAEVADPTNPERTDLVVLDESGSTVLDTSERGATLFDVSPVDGEPTVFYGTLPGDNTDEVPGELFRRAFDEDAPTRLDVAFAPEYGVARTSQAAGVVVISAGADLTEQFTFVDLQGEPVEGIFNPTTEAPYNAPPYWAEAVLAPDGTEYAYLEGPDLDGVDGSDVLIGDWQLVVVSTKGVERVRLMMAPQSTSVWRLDFDGRFAVASLGPIDAKQPTSVLVVDTKASKPVPTPLCGLTGTATIAD